MMRLLLAIYALLALAFLVSAGCHGARYTCGAVASLEPRIVDEHDGGWSQHEVTIRAMAHDGGPEHSHRDIVVPGQQNLIQLEGEASVPQGVALEIVPASDMVLVHGPISYHAGPRQTMGFLVNIDENALGVLKYKLRLLVAGESYERRVEVCAAFAAPEGLFATAERVSGCAENDLCKDVPSHLAGWCAEVGATTVPEGPPRDEPSLNFEWMLVAVVAFTFAVVLVVAAWR